MSTKRLKKRDRTWAKGMVMFWHCTALGRDRSTTSWNRLRNARSAAEFIAERDPFQQEALAPKP